MKQYEKNKLKMYQSVESICTAHPSDWNNLPAFTIFFAQFTAKVDELEQSSYDQGIAIAGVAANKEQVLSATIAKAEIIANALRSHAATTKNTLLANQLKFTKWSYTKGGGQVAIERVNRILNNAVQYFPALADYGIVQTDIDELSGLRDQLDETIGSPRNAIIDRKNATTTISGLMQEIDALLKEHLDRLVEILRPTHPVFYRLFKGARVIVDLKGKHNELDRGDTETPPENSEGTR